MSSIVGVTDENNKPLNTHTMNGEIIINGVSFTLDSVLRDLAREYADGMLMTEEFLDFLEDTIYSTIKTPKHHDRQRD